MALLGTCGVCTIAANSGSETRVEVVEPSLAPPYPAEAAVEIDYQIPSSDRSAPPPAALPPPDLPPFDKGVVIEFEIRNTDERLPLVTGVTNLPNGTHLMVSVESKRGFNGSAKSTVVGGRFSAGPFGPTGGLPDGMYTAEIMTPIVGVQPDEVQAILGKKGKNLKGKLVHDEDGDKSVAAHAEFHIGSDAGSASKADQAELANSKQIAKAVYDEAMALVDLGTGTFDSLRGRRDMAAAERCGELMHGVGGSVDRAKAVRTLADGLPNNPYFDLKVATIELQLCVTCSGSSAENCQMAKSSLRKAKKTIR